MALKISLSTARKLGTVRRAERGPADLGSPTVTMADFRKSARWSTSPIHLARRWLRLLRPAAGGVGFSFSQRSRGPPPLS